MAVDEAVAQVGQDSGSNNSHDEGAPTDQATEMESTCNKEVIPLSTTNMQVKGERKELADDVKPLNEPDKNVASDDTSILQVLAYFPSLFEIINAILSINCVHSKYIYRHLRIITTEISYRRVLTQLKKYHLINLMWQKTMTIKQK